MKLFRIGAVVGALTTALAAAPAQAQVVMFSGWTSGCFYVASGPACTPSSTQMFETATQQGLTYYNSQFNVMTSNLGQVGIGGNAVAGANNNNLGAFALTPPASGTANYNDMRFAMRVTFTSPNVVGTSSQIFTAMLMGSVTATAGGGVLIDFDNSWRTYTFDSSQPNGLPGTFRFRVDDVSVFQGEVIAGSGFIEAQVVPEPISMALLGSGLAGMGGLGALRRRRQKGETS